MALPIGHFRRDGYDVYMKDAGEDYWQVVRACIEENISREQLLRNFPARSTIEVRRDDLEITLVALAYTNPKRMVFRLETGGRRFILKRAFMGTVGIKKLFPGVMGLTYFTRIMKKVARATAAGCTSTQDYFLVAERQCAAFRQEAWLLLEYLEGESLGDKPAGSFRGELDAAMRDLLHHGLTMDDLTPHNFLVDGGKVRAIDISCRPFTRLQSVKMVMKANALYGLNIPVTGWINSVILALLSARYRIFRSFGTGIW